MLLILLVANKYYVNCQYHADPTDPFNITVISIPKSEVQDLDVKICWRRAAESYEDMQMNSFTSYIVKIIPESEELNQSTIKTSNMFVQYSPLFHDHEYNISVEARNCIGTSKPAVVHITGDG